jgi:hypothetical protein
MAIVLVALDKLSAPEIGFANSRTRRAGAQKRVHVDVRVPAQRTVSATHRDAGPNRAHDHCGATANRGVAESADSA